MKVCGFTFIRNAEKYDYPILEAINSILPICDKFIVAVGNSEDNTLELIKSINSDKIEIIQTIWDDSLRVGGRVLADETNKAFQAIPEEYDWCFYIQGDEVVHEKYLPIIKEEMQNNLDRNQIDGLLFNYTHFYGSYNYVGESYGWYRNEIRIVRNNKNIYSFRDAQGFRKDDNKKLNAKAIAAHIYHYGWVKDPRSMQKKQEDFNKLWHNDEWIKKNVASAEEFDYDNMQSLRLFDSEHPKVMTERIERINWDFDYDISFKRTKFKDKFKRFFEKMGFSVGQYKNYKLIK